jgi:sugar-specific transcriptional regulator TrmB
MQQALRKALEQASLSSDEIALYLCLLKEQRVSISTLIARTKLPSTTVYRSMQKLTERGLIHRTRINGKQSLYAPLSLERLARTLARDQIKLKKLELSIRRLDPLLRYISLANDTPDEIEVREGLDAFREEYLKMPEVFSNEYLHVGSAPNFWKVAKMHYECAEERGFINRRLSKNLYARVLNTPSREALEVQRNDTREKRTVVLTEAIPIVKDFVLVAEHQVSHFICDEEHPRVIINRAPEAVAAHHDHFERLWKASH